MIKLPNILISTLIFIIILKLIWNIFDDNFKFNIINKLNLWFSTESMSGDGSEIQNTKVISNILPKIIKKYKIKTLFDCPCGDMNYMSKILEKNLKIKYTGGDIVQKLVIINRKKYPIYKFIHFDIINNKISKYDLIIVKDLLNHISFSNIQKILSNIKKSGSKYLLLNNHNKTLKNKIHFKARAPFWIDINWNLDPWKKLNIIKNFNSDNKDHDYVLIKL
tara:strand:+ start:3028 stop:3690 length:663 start_codon:yes stop_codon:yes gene_type:complete